ncbi:MAG: ribonuclease H-like YkuK family protein [Patescibacteria group bacterium]|nr:ribonuclease H-like YkuK family protein [Patescibacteria group bacterium]MDE2144693.1 ribonuclease H-like YkuK family protein [Patescibacteria group bacterium]
MDFLNNDGEKFSVSGVIESAIGFMKQDPERSYKIMIGTDSALYNSTDADFVTAIVIHRIGKGARYFWRRSELKNFHTLRDRMIKEAMMSIDVAQQILSYLKEAKAPDFDFEIHIDVGSNGETKTVMQEVVGLIRANNFEVKTKPESCAASNVADRYT